MKRFLSMYFLLVLFFLSGCAKQTDIPKESPVWAYWNTFEELLVTPGASISDDIIYLAFDFSKVDLEEKEVLIEMAKEYCKDHDYTFLEGTMDDLIEQGYISTENYGSDEVFAGAFENGALISIETLSTEETEIVAKGSIWRANLSVVGATYTISLQDGEWLVSYDSFWVS